MARSVSAALQAELSRTVTRIGYLVSFSTTPVMRWCDVGAVDWDGMVFVEYDFTLTGIGGASPSMTVQNLDSVVAAIFLAADMSAVTVDVWQCAPAATAVPDVVRIGRYMLGDAEIGLDKMTVTLIPENSLDAFAPRRRIDASNGFAYAMPVGTQIAWENEIFIVERADG